MVNAPTQRALVMWTRIGTRLGLKQLHRSCRIWRGVDGGVIGGSFGADYSRQMFHLPRYYLFYSEMFSGGEGLTERIWNLKKITDNDKGWSSVFVGRDMNEMELADAIRVNMKTMDALSGRLLIFREFTKEEMGELNIAKNKKESDQSPKREALE